MKLLNANETAAMLSITTRTLYCWAREGKITVLTDGRNYRWLEAEVIAYQILRWDLRQELPKGIPAKRMEEIRAYVRKALKGAKPRTSANTIAHARQLGRV